MCEINTDTICKAHFIRPLAAIHSEGIPSHAPECGKTAFRTFDFLKFHPGFLQAHQVLEYIIPFNSDTSEINRHMSSDVESNRSSIEALCHFQSLEGKIFMPHRRTIPNLHHPFQEHRRESSQIYMNRVFPNPIHKHPVANQQGFPSEPHSTALFP